MRHTRTPHTKMLEGLALDSARLPPLFLLPGRSRVLDASPSLATPIEIRPFFLFFRQKVILNGVKFFSGHGELFLESLKQVVEILSQSPDYKGGRTGRCVALRVASFRLRFSCCCPLASPLCVWNSGICGSLDASFPSCPSLLRAPRLTVH